MIVNKISISYYVDKLNSQLQDRLIGMALDNAAEDEAVAKDLVNYMKNPNVW